MRLLECIDYQLKINVSAESESFFQFDSVSFDRSLYIMDIRSWLVLEGA